MEHQTRMTMAKTLTIIELMQQFGSEESCKSYLADQKWGDGFVCRRCGHDHAVKGRTRHAERLSMASLTMISKETQIVDICNNSLTFCLLRI